MNAGARAAFLICVSLRLFAASPDLLIRNVTVIDLATGASAPKRSILIHKDRIAAVGSAVHRNRPTRIVDASGKFVIPGFWDMHVHLNSRGQLPLYVAWGVTGVRDMGSDYDRVRLWREEMQQGKLVGPHIETCGPALNGVSSGDPRLAVRVVRGPGDARAVFDQLDDESVDFIGILPGLPRDAYFALIERARKYYSIVAGDVPAGVSVLEAVEARQRSIDHMSGILLSCSSEEKRFRPAYIQALEHGDPAALDELQEAALETFSPEKARALFERMALFETRIVPTLAKLCASGCHKDVYERLIQLLIEMQHAGVSIMAGSGSGNPGEALHQELELLVAAGLTPAQALRCATLEPAKYLDAAESFGDVAEGRTADLVLLSADPLTDIRNTRKIAAVVLGGRYLPHGTSAGSR